MKIKIRLVSVLAFLTGMLCMSCKDVNVPRADSDYSREDMWYQTETEFDTNKVDVLYFVSTDVLSAEDEDGNEVWQSQLTDDDKAAMDEELRFVERNIFCHDFNLSAPYYHQFTFNSVWKLDRKSFDDVFRQVSSEACEAFDYYMKNMNKGRAYILAGFSQGAMLTVDILKHMTDEQFSRMIACYTIGYRLTADDLKHPHIQPAQGEHDCGVVISFNSSQTRASIWPFVSEGAATCINPVNWKTDTTPATFTYDGTTNTVSADSVTHTLLIHTDTPSYFHNYYDQATFYQDAQVSTDNLHHWDLLFYTHPLHDNALNRSKAYKATHKAVR